MKLNAFVSVLISILVVVAMSNVNAQTKSDTTSIENIVNDEVSAWNKGDAINYSKHFAEDGTFTNILGMFFTGHQAFVERHDDIFKGKFKDTRLEMKIVALKFVRPDVVIVECLTWTSGFLNGPLPGTVLDDKGRLCTRLLQVIAKTEGEWKIVTYHNIDVKPAAFGVKK